MTETFWMLLHRGIFLSAVETHAAASLPMGKKWHNSIEMTTSAFCVVCKSLTVYSHTY